MSDEDQFDDGFDGSDEFDLDTDFQGGQSIKELWRKNPIFKFGVIIVGLVIIIISVNIFGSNDVKIETSAVGSGQGSNVRGAVGGEVTDVYRNALETRNEQDFEQAQEDAGSFLPVPVDPIKTSIAPMAREAEEKDDPMAQWKELQEKRLRRQNEENQRRRMMELQNQRAMASMPQQADPNAEARGKALGQLSGAMMEQMAMIAKRQEYKAPHKMSIITDEAYTNKVRSGLGGGIRGMNGVDGMGGMGGLDGLDNNDQQMMSLNNMNEEEPLINPGEIVYGQMLIEANSDIPSVVLGQVLTGYFEGSRIMGSFSVEKKYLVLNFDKIMKDGRAYRINAMAVDPATSLPGLATEVDQRYFKRIFLPAASKFIEGVSEAVTEGGNTNVVSSTTGETVAVETADLNLNEELLKGVSEASSIVTEMLEEISDDTKVLIRVEAGTPFGILFVDPVYESNRIRSRGQAGMGGTSSPFGAPTPTMPSGTTNAAAGPAGFDPSMLNLVPDL
tara:strand:+ start:370312 stop:371820 length:1509 start_codon:yes stop_codon:yes gene_type:complete